MDLLGTAPALAHSEHVRGWQADGGAAAGARSEAAGPPAGAPATAAAGLPNGAPAANGAAARPAGGGSIADQVPPRRQNAWMLVFSGTSCKGLPPADGGGALSCLTGRSAPTRWAFRAPHVGQTPRAGHLLIQQPLFTELAVPSRTPCAAPARHPVHLVERACSPRCRLGPAQMEHMRGELAAVQQARPG